MPAVRSAQLPPVPREDLNVKRRRAATSGPAACPCSRTAAAVASVQPDTARPAMPRGGGGGVRRSELAVAAAAATGSLLYCMCSARSGDRVVPPPRQTAKASSTRAAVPTGLPAPTFGGGIFESLDDDMVLLVLRHLSRIGHGADTLNAAADAAAAALISAGGINRQWRRLSGLRCFWSPLCQYHFRIGAEPVECPRWCAENGALPPAQRLGDSASSSSYYEALGLHEGATAQDIAAAYAAVVRRAASAAAGSGNASAAARELPVTASEWRQCWLSWHAEAATTIGHTHVPLQRREPPRLPLPPQERQSRQRPEGRQSGNRPIDGQLWCRVVDCWRRIHDFCEAEHPAVLASLLPPADSASWIQFIEELGLQQYETRLEPLRLLYCAHNGQSTQLDRLLDAGDVGQALKHHLDIFAGLLGGYCVQDHMPCGRLYSLEKSVHATLEVRELPGMQLPPQCFVIAGSYDIRKCFFCDAATLDVFVAAPMQQLAGATGVYPAHPQDTQQLQAQQPAETGTGGAYAATGAGEQQHRYDNGAQDHTHSSAPASVNVADGLLRWLEEYSRRLEQRRYRATELVRGTPPTLAISLLPAVEPYRCCVVHRDVEVCGSVLFAPELGRHVYSVSIRLLVEGVDARAIGPAARGFNDCQLRSRVLEMHGSPDSNPRRAGGAGVVGRCPLLRVDGQWRDDVLDQTVQSLDGGPLGSALGAALRPGPVHRGAFTYQSATDHLPTSSIVGRFQFVPGSLRHPAGEQFEVVVGPFECGGDDFLY
jgi:hypothetical protein